MMCANCHARSQRGRQTPQYADPLALEAIEVARWANTSLGEALVLTRNLLDQVAALRRARMPGRTMRTPALQLTLPDVEAQLVLWAW
jgi:hypothetical protein